MPWPTIEIDSWEVFERQAARLAATSPTQVPYLLRGQANEAWKLSPGINRLFKEGVSAEEMLKVERVGLSQFQRQAHLHLPQSVMPGASLMAGELFVPEWWALMQHYSAPTRMLDWTVSPYVALYFAVERETDKAGAIFLIHRETVSDSFYNHFPDGTIDPQVICSPTTPASVLAWIPMRSTERIVAQQGYFTFGTHIASDHEKIIAEQCGTARDKMPNAIFHERWVVPPTKKYDFLRRLRTMNIGAHSLFPGIDGLGRSLAELARIASPI